MPADRTGWICPRCQSALSPDVARCSCAPQMQPFTPTYPPTPYDPTLWQRPWWEQPGITFEVTCSNLGGDDSARIQQAIAVASRVYGAPQ